MNRSFLLAFPMALAAREVRAEGPSPPDPLTMQWTVETATSAHPAVDAARARARAASQGVERAWGLPDPMLMVEGMPAYRFGMGAGMVMYQATQSIPLGATRSRSAEAARFETRAARADIETVGLDLTLAARLAFVRLAETEAIRAAREEELALSRAALEVVRARTSTGAGSSSGALATELMVSEAESALALARGEEEAARAALGGFLGIESGRPLPRAAPLVLPAGPAPLDDLLASARRFRPERSALAARARAAEARASAARATAAPMLTVGIGYMQDFQMQDGLWGMLGVSLPVWSGARQAEVSQAAEETVAFTSDVAGFDRSVAGEVAAVRAALEAAIERARLVEDQVVPQAEARHSLAVAEYARGTEDLFGLLDAVRSLVASRLEAVRSVAEAVRRDALLGRATGG